MKKYYTNLPNKRCPACGKWLPRGNGEHVTHRMYCDKKCLVTKPPKFVALERDFDEPWQDIVRAFVKRGYSCRAIALTLGFQYLYFRRAMKKFEMFHKFPKRADFNDACRGVGNKRRRGDKT
jgi:hypothetical protein